MASLLSLLNQKANASNKECQAIQAKMKKVLDAIIHESRFDEKTRDAYQSQINTLCDDYSISINSLEIETLSKCKRLCDQDAAVRQPRSNSRRRLLRTPRHSSDVESEPESEFSEISSDSDAQWTPNRKQRRRGSSNSDSGYACDECGKVLSSQHNLRDHIARFHLERKFACKECDRRFALEYDMWKHRRRVHNASPLECSDCSLTFRFQKQLILHQREVCNKVPQVVEEHGDDAEEGVEGEAEAEHDEQYACDQCDSSFASVNALGGHRAWHTTQARANGRVYTCNECGMVFDSPHALGGHRASTGHGNTSSSATFTNSTGGLACDKFSQAGLLDHIARLHSGRKFACKECGRRFALKGTMNDHRRRVHNARPFECALCKRTFKFHKQLAEHEFIERQEHDDCGKSFASKQALTGHRALTLGGHSSRIGHRASSSHTSSPAPAQHRHEPLRRVKAARPRPVPAPVPSSRPLTIHKYTVHLSAHQQRGISDEQKSTGAAAGVKRKMRVDNESTEEYDDNAPLRKRRKRAEKLPELEEHKLKEAQ